MKISKIEVLEKAYKYYGLRITDTMLYHYIKKGLIKGVERYYKKGVSGSISNYPKNTPGLLYLIKTMNTKGMKLKEIGAYLSLLKLDYETVKDIKNIFQEHNEFEDTILFKNGITPDVKEYLLKEVPLKLLNRLRITKKEKLYEILQLRSYIEIDPEVITNLIFKYSKDVETFKKLENALDNPMIITNIDELDLTDKEAVKSAYVLVHYKKPINIKIKFTKNNEIKIIKI